MYELSADCRAWRCGLSRLYGGRAGCRDMDSWRLEGAERIAMLSQIRDTICQVYAESSGSVYFAGVTGKPLPTPLFYRFKLAGGYATTKTGYRRVLVADMKQERIRAELDERIGVLLKKYADDLPGRVVTFADRPLAIQIPNPKPPAPIAWRSDIPATLQSIPLGVAYDWSGQQPIFWNRANDAHAIISGVTGSGKSILLCSILASLVAHVSPDELEVVAIDMKGRSLSPFENAPHLRHGVASESGAAIALLSALDAELDTRIANGRNQPAICLAVDELTDLLEGDSVAQAWFARIARMGRELGIFILAGTQKPLVSEVGQAKSQLSLRLVGRMRNGKDAETAAGTAVDADSLYHPGSFFAVTGADRSTLFRGLYVTADNIRQACTTFRGGSPSALRPVSTKTVETGRAAVKEEAANVQAEQDAATLRDKLKDKLDGSSMREKVLALGLNPAGSNWYVGKARVEKAWQVLTTIT